MCVRYHFLTQGEVIPLVACVGLAGESFRHTADHSGVATQTERKQCCLRRQRESREGGRERGKQRVIAKKFITAESQLGQRGSNVI